MYVSPRLRPPFLSLSFSNGSMSSYLQAYPSPYIPATAPYSILITSPPDVRPVSAFILSEFTSSQLQDSRYGTATMEYNPLPTAVKQNKTCRFFRQPDGCHYGQRCRFSHDVPNPRMPRITNGRQRIGEFPPAMDSPVRVKIPRLYHP